MTHLHRDAGMFGFLGYLGMVSVVINIILLSVLLYIYIQNYRQIKSRFTAGLIMFASIFLVQNIMWILFFLFLRDMRAPTMGLPNFILTVVETAGLAILLKLTWE